MKLTRSAKLAFNMLVHSKLRSWLTIIGIVIGVAAVVIIITAGASAEATLESQLTQFGTDTIQINPKGTMGMGGGPVAGKLTDKDLQALEGIPGVAMMTPQVMKQAEITYAGETKLMNVIAMKPSVWSAIAKDEMDTGRLLLDSDTKGILIGSNVAKDAFDRSINVNQQVLINGQNFRVVGINKFGGLAAMANNYVVMHIDSAKDLLFLPGEEIKYIEIDLVVSPGADINAVAQEAERRLLISKHESASEATFSVVTPEDILNTVQEITSMITLFLGAIAVISLVVGAVGIMNTMFTSVLEKTKEIGIMKAIGARNRDIISIFLLNAGMVGFVGGFLGCAIGLGITYAIAYGINMYGITFELAISPMFVLEALLLATIIGMLAGAIPAYRASRLKPVEALRYE